MNGVFLCSADQGGDAAPPFSSSVTVPADKIKPTVDTELGGGAHECQDFLLRLPTEAEVCSACDVKSVQFFERHHIIRRSQKLSGSNCLLATDRMYNILQSLPAEISNK